MTPPDSVNRSFDGRNAANQKLHCVNAEMHGSLAAYRNEPSSANFFQMSVAMIAYKEAFDAYSKACEDFLAAEDNYYRKPTPSA